MEEGREGEGPRREAEGSGTVGEGAVRRRV